jgi:hypothetical protein
MKCKDPKFKENVLERTNPSAFLKLFNNAAINLSNLVKIIKWGLTDRQADRKLNNLLRYDITKKLQISTHIRSNVTSKSSNIATHTSFVNQHKH